MKCRSCANAGKVEPELKVLAEKVAKIRLEPILNVKKREKIEVLKDSEVLMKGEGVDTMTFKPTDGENPYIKCDCEEHLVDLKLGPDKVFVIHKYYFTCPHFKEKT